MGLRSIPLLLAARSTLWLGLAPADLWLVRPTGWLGMAQVGMAQVGMAQGMAPFLTHSADLR